MTIREALTDIVDDLKARLAEKKAQVAGSGQEHEGPENAKKNQREM